MCSKLPGISKPIMKIYFAADHAGFTLKNTLLNYVRGELSHEVEDCGALQHDPDDDYPDFIAVAARKLQADVLAERPSRAILMGASGQGEAIVANRFPGVRAAVYYGGNPEIVKLSREHNDANALSLGARFISEDEAKAAVKQWLNVLFTGEARHVRRIGKIDGSEE